MIRMAEHCADLPSKVLDRQYNYQLAIVIAMIEHEQKPTLEDAMAEWLDAIDRILALAGVPLHRRPMPAAAEFVDRCVTRVDEIGDGEGVPPGKLTDYATTKWFRLIYKTTQQWYRDRFGEAMDARQPDVHDAVVLIRDTPYLLRVPMTTLEPGTLGESVWLCYHDTVQPDEDVLAWVQRGPIFANLGTKDVKAAHGIVVEIATRIRATYIALLGLGGGTDTKVIELRDAILPHLERAARQLSKADAEDIRLAHWDMQMACELAMKCVAQQRVGTFKETHDLFTLYDHMPGAPLPFARKELSKLPNWEMMVDLRYGGGPTLTMRQAFRSYRAAVTIVAATASALITRYRFGKAKFHIARAPWTGDI